MGLGRDLPRGGEPLGLARGEQLTVRPSVSKQSSLSVRVNHERVSKNDGAGPALRSDHRVLGSAATGAVGPRATSGTSLPLRPAHTDSDRNFHEPAFGDDGAGRITYGHRLPRSDTYVYPQRYRGGNPLASLCNPFALIDGYPEATPFC